MCYSSDLSDYGTTRLIAQSLVNLISFHRIPQQDFDPHLILLTDSIFQFCCRDSLCNDYGAAFLYVERLYEQFLWSVIVNFTSEGANLATLKCAVNIIVMLYNTKCKVALNDITSLSICPEDGGRSIDRCLAHFHPVHTLIHEHLIVADPQIWRETQRCFEQ